MVFETRLAIPVVDKWHRTWMDLVDCLQTNNSYFDCSTNFMRTGFWVTHLVWTSSINKIWVLSPKKRILSHVWTRLCEKVKCKKTSDDSDGRGHSWKDGYEVQGKQRFLSTCPELTLRSQTHNDRDRTTNVNLVRWLWSTYEHITYWRDLSIVYAIYQMFSMLSFGIF